MNSLKRLLLCSPLLLSSSCQTGGDVAATERVLPWEIRANSWRTDAAWYDGTAEKSVFQATRSIYGKPRSYLATAYTNKQPMDPRTSTKSSSNAGIEVFKHHWSERIETENYDYDYSTASFTASDKLTPFKLTVATQEDCGASFKQIWHANGSLRTLESVYFPDAGVSESKLECADFVFGDALSLVLRDFPFGDTEAQDLRVLPSQKSTKHVSFEPQLRRVVPRGEETLQLPIGETQAQRLDLTDPESGALLASYWFASESAAPWMHALVRYAGPGGVSFELLSHERTAYWERK